MTDAQLLGLLEKAVEGLTWESETDEPLTIFFWESRTGEATGKAAGGHTREATIKPEGESRTGAATGEAAGGHTREATIRPEGESGTGEATRQTIDARTVAHRAGLPADRPAEETTVAAFLGSAGEEEEWFEAEEKARAARFRELASLVGRELKDPSVFIFGAVERDVLLVGRFPSGALGGVRTRVVET